MFLLQAGLSPVHLTTPRQTGFGKNAGKDPDDSDTAGKPVWSLCSADMDKDPNGSNPSNDIESVDEWTRQFVPAREVAEPGDEDGTALYVQQGQTEMERPMIAGGIIGGFMDRGAHIVELLRHREPRNETSAYFN